MKIWNFYKNIDEYINLVITGKIHACKEQRSLIKFLEKEVRDNNEIFIDEITIDRFIEVTEKYFFPLYPAQKMMASLILGCRYKKTGFLVFPSVFIMMGRGGGKNGFISALSFFLTSTDNRNITYEDYLKMREDKSILWEIPAIKNYHVDIVANSEEQAKCSFQEVYSVVDSPSNKIKKLYRYNLKEITFKKTGSTLKYRTSNPKTKDGLRSGCVIFDEIHEYDNDSIIHVFTGGLGKVSDPRQIYITTNGFNRESVLDNMIDRAEKILNEERPHNGFLPIIFKLDNIKELGKEELWDKANPRINYDETLKNVIKNEYEDTKYSETAKEAFLTKRMNLPYRNKNLAICSVEDLKSTMGEIPDLTGEPCIAGVDFADLNDFCSAVLRFEKDGNQYVLHHTWIHETALEGIEYNVDLRSAIKEGWAELVKTEDHRTISPDLVAEWFQKMAKKYYIKSIHCDSFRWSALEQAFNAVGLGGITKEVRSGSISHNKVAPLILQLFKDRKIFFGEDKMMRWYVSNSKVITDKKGNKTFQKIEPYKRKTDGFFALVHSFIDVEENALNGNDFQFYEPILF